MTPQKLKVIKKKLADGSATLKERLLFVKELNTAIEGLRKEIKKVKNNKK